MTSDSTSRSGAGTRLRRSRLLYKLAAEAFLSGFTFYRNINLSNGPSLYP